MNDFLTLFKYPVDGPVDKTDYRNPNNYVPYYNGNVEDSRFRHNSNQRVIKTTESILRPQSQGFYLGIQDTGTCGEITRLVVYYTFRKEEQRELVVYPEFADPPINGPSETFQAQCVCNAHNTTSLDVHAFSDGQRIVYADKASGGARCECDDGYEIDSSRTACIREF